MNGAKLKLHQSLAHVVRHKLLVAYSVTALSVVALGLGAIGEVCAGMHDMHYGPRGFTEQFRTVTAIQNHGRDDEDVYMRGRLTNYLCKDRYEFTDETGSAIEVELDDDVDWSPVYKDQLIEIYGEIDRNLFRVRVDAKAYRILEDPIIHNDDYIQQGTPATVSAVSAVAAPAPAMSPAAAPAPASAAPAPAPAAAAAFAAPASAVNAETQAVGSDTEVAVDGVQEAADKTSVAPENIDTEAQSGSQRGFHPRLHRGDSERAFERVNSMSASRCAGGTCAQQGIEQATN